MAPLIPNLGTRRRCVVNCSSQSLPRERNRYPWKMRLGGPQSQSGQFYNNNNNNNNNNNILLLGCYPVGVVILHVNKT